nr:T9SS type A sorting domain-containing protein [Chitinophagaceae bacterium]
MRYILLLLFIFSMNYTNATHLASGEIQYTHLNGLNYYVKVKMVRDCSGAPALGSIVLNSYSATLMQNVNTNLGLNLLQGYNISGFCPGLTTTCYGGAYPGYEVLFYEGNVTLPAVANDWVFSTSHCCRNNALDNILNPGVQNFVLMSTLNNTGGVPPNNSVQFMLGDQYLFKTNQTYNTNLIANDIDGDSLSYSVVTPIASITNGVPTYCNFVNPFNNANPFPGSFTLNPSDGNLSFNCNVQGTFAVATKVNEYRNGVLVGSVIKDMHLTFIADSPNNLPTLSGVNGGPNYFTSINVCPGNSLSFTVNSADLDLGDSVFITMNTNNIPGSTLTTSNAPQQVGTFTWTPSPADIRPQPYVLGLKARDNHCDLLGTQNFAYLIYVNQCNLDTVWPGDANADFVVNNYDVLNLGLAFGATGVVRPGANTSWTAQYCANWVDTFINGVNYKHADCDGDGAVGNTDWAVVTLNYGQFHLKNNQLGRYKTRGLPDLFFDTNGLEAIPGTTLQIPVHLGSVGSPMNSIYGIAGKIMVSNTLSNNITLSNSTSWMGTAANSYLFQKNSGGFNATEFALVKKDQQAVSGNGQIATLSVPIDANASIGSDLILDFANLKLIDNEGKEITDYNVLSDTLKIVWPTKVSTINEQRDIEIYPNPVSDVLTVEIHTKEIASYEIDICDITGKSIYTRLISGQKHTINTASFSKGVYFVKIVHDKGTRYSYKISK